MLEAEVVDRARAQAEKHEANLPKGQRKQLGQFFTGMKLGRILAHLAVEDDTSSILDPMAGSGDLLDAAAEAAASRGVRLEDSTAWKLTRRPQIDVSNALKTPRLILSLIPKSSVAMHLRKRSAPGWQRHTIL